VAVGDGSPGVPEEHPERVVAVVLAARFFFHGGAGAAVQEALLAGAAAGVVPHMMRPAPRAGRARRRPPLRVGSGKGMESWTTGCARVACVARVGDSGEGICARRLRVRKEDEASRAQLAPPPAVARRLGPGAGRGGGFGIGFSFSWVGWRVPEPGDKIDKFIHKIWFPI